MNVLFIGVNSPFESVGGIERYLSNLIGYCNEVKHEITLLLPAYEDRSYEEQHGAARVYFDPSLTITSADRKQAAVCIAKSKDFAAALEQIIEERKIDTICAEDLQGIPPAFNLQLNMIASLHSIHLALHIHSFATTPLQSELINQLPWDKILCVSRSVSGDCFNKGADISKLTTHYLGVNREIFRDENRMKLKTRLELKPENKVVLIATRIIRGDKDILQQKGIIDTIRAFSKLTASHPELRLVIAVGTPPRNLEQVFKHAREKLQGYLQIHGVADKTLVQSFEMGEMPIAYSGADIFVLPSENETFGQVFIEAMSCGTPVIGTKVGGIPEIIQDSLNGFLVQPNDPTKLSQRIETTLYNQDIRDGVVSKAKDTVHEKFDTKTQLGGLLKMLKEMKQTTNAHVVQL